MTATEILASVVSIISVIVSIISIVFAVISWSISHHVNQKMLEIEEKREQDRLVEQNTGKVKIVAVRNSKQFLIYNEGPIDIRITDIILNGTSIRQHPCFDFQLKDIKIPSGDNFFILEMRITSQTGDDYLPPYDVVVKWITANGDEQQTEMTVNWV